MTQYAGLTLERWSRFELPQQILQIAVELQRGLKLLSVDRLPQLRACYDGALDLLRLTIELQPDGVLRSRLDALGNVIARLEQQPEPDPRTHRETLRAILELHPESAEQVRILGLDEPDGKG